MFTKKSQTRFCDRPQFLCDKKLSQCLEPSFKSLDQRCQHKFFSKLYKTLFFDVLIQIRSSKIIFDKSGSFLNLMLFAFFVLPLRQKNALFFHQLLNSTLLKPLYWVVSWPVANFFNSKNYDIITRKLWKSTNIAVISVIWGQLLNCSKKP